MSTNAIFLRGVCAARRPLFRPLTRFERRALTAAVSGIWMVILPSTGHAEVTAPSQVAPQSLRPPSDAPDAGVLISRQAAPTAPPGASDLTVVVGDVQIQGAFPELAEAVAPLIAGIRGRRVVVAKVFELAKTIESLYAKAGYPLVRVVVPQQRLDDRGALVLVVVDGFIEDIDVAGVPERVRSIVAARTSSIIGRPHIKRDEIERALLLAGDLPGLKLRSTLMPGASDGGARLVLEGEHRVITGSTGGDDRLAQSLGTWQLRGSIASNSALGMGEQIYGSIGLSADLNAAANGSAPLSVYGGGVVVPIGVNGLTLNPEYTHSATRTAQSPDVPASVGTFERYALRLHDPVIRTRNSSLSINASVEYITQQIAAPAFNALLSDDRYGVARIGPDYSTLLPWGAALQIGGALSEGLGGRSDVQALTSGIPLSRQGAGPDFIKLNGNAVASAFDGQTAVAFGTIFDRRRQRGFGLRDRDNQR
jgi:hemolysin activation/secretion protein